MGPNCIDRRPRPPGALIAFEGGEGAGKTTHSRLLLDTLLTAGLPARQLREPGGTDLGEHLRIYLKSDRPLSPQSELMLFAAARAEMCSAVLLPALAAGSIVILDRYIASTLAYQGCGRRLPREFIQQINRFVTHDRSPDLTFLLDLDPELGLQRSAQQQSFGIDLRQQARPLPPSSADRRFDNLPLSVHKAIREGFLQLARDNAATWKTLDATRPIEENAETILKILAQRQLIPELKPEPARPGPQPPLAAVPAR